jgi:aldose 1-epimerase
MRYIAILFILIFIHSCKTKENNNVRTVMMPDGRAVKVFHLINKQGISVDVMEYGATLLNILTPDKNGKFINILAGYDSVETYFRDKSYFGCVVGRYANRIAEGKFKLNNIEYQLKRNEKNTNHLHGGIEGLNKRLWQGVPIIADKSQAVKLSYMSPDGEEGYPGNLNISVTYTLNDSNDLHIDYQAVTDKATVVNLSNHSYYNLSGNCQTSILEHQLQINADSFLMVNSNLIPVGNGVSVLNTPFDFRKPKNIGKDINALDSQLVYCNGGYDHNFILNSKAKNDHLNFALRLCEPKSGRVLEFFTDQPGLQFYSGNFLNGSIAGKNGCVYKKYDALVFETQKFPDSPNHPEYPSTELNPGQTYSHHTILKFKVSE